jgi:PAS domain S-box-containing protein
LRFHSIVALTDSQGTILDINDKFVEISGYSRDELIGANHRIINSGHHDPVFWKRFWNTIRSGEIFKEEIKNKRKDGTFYWVDTTIIPFYRPEQKEFFFLAIRTNITERKEKVQQELSQHSHKASLAELSMTSIHEVGNLFSIIGCHLWRLEKDPHLQEESRSAIVKIQQALDRCANIFQRFKQLSSSLFKDHQEGAGHLRQEAISLQKAMEIISDLFSYRFEQDNIIYRASLHRSDLQVLSSMDILTQSLINLISNALHALQQIDDDRQLIISTSEDKDMAYIHVQDNGPGIATHLRPKLFQEFFTTKKNGEGSGIGLNYSKTILQKHGGDLHYLDGEEKTTFRISIPKVVNS